MVLTIRGSRRRMTVHSGVIKILKLKDDDKLWWVVFNDGRARINKVKK